MATGSPVREFTSDELDALAAAELPVQEPLPPTASAPVASTLTAPDPTGSPGLITGEGALPARGPAMGPVAQLEAREYTTEEIDVLEKSSTPPPPQEFTSEQLDQEAVAALDDPTYSPTRDEYFELKATKERLKSEGKIPGTAELAAQAVGGLVVTALDAFNTAVYSPLETIAKSPATLQTGIGRAALGAMQLGGWVKEGIQGAPKYRDEETGEFFFYNNEVQLQNALESGRKLRPTTEDDLKDHEFEGYIAKKGIDAEYQDLATKTAPTELLTMLTTGRRQQETPNLSQAGVIEMVADPTNLIPFGAGAKAIGLSRGMKVLSSEAANAVEKVAGGFVKGNDALAERFANVVTNATGFTPRDISAAGKVLNFGKNVGIGGGIAAGAAAVGAPPELAATIAGFYPVYKAGFGVLRKIETGAGTAKIILRESADATNGLDQAARAAVLANDAVPQAFKEVLERPSQFVSIESTPARLAANQALSPQMRALASKLSNPAIVQAVRGSSAVATGAVKGAAINAPFSLLAANAGDDEEAAAILGAGAAFGAAGGGVQRFTGLQQRRQQAAISDVSRMLVDVELNGGDVSKMMSTQTPDSLVKLAAMQGTFRNALDFVPLNSTDYNANVQAQGGAGSAGLFVQSAPGERAKVFINLDAKRTGIEPHEFGHALLASGALDGQQKYAARAWVDKTYGPEGVQARAREYASNIIRGKNASAFPDGNFEISPSTLAAEMDNLSQGGLARGDMDGLDWARDEIFAETFAKASNTMDFAAIRRGAPAGGNMLTFAESVLGAQARALSASGVRIDPQTGQALDTPGSLFKENPILATDKALLNQLGTYINNYRQWANDPSHEKPRPNRIAPSGRASDIANNPQVTFYDRGDGVKATTFATQDPATGQAILRDQRDLNQEHAKVKEQIRNIVGSKLIPDSNPVLGPKKTADGRVTVRGRVLPPSFDFLNGFMPHIRAFARQFEALGAAGESMQVRYHAIGSGDTGAFRVNRLGNLEAITREVIHWGWELTKAGNLNATVLDLSQFRNRAMRGIAERNPALAPFDYDMGKIEADLKTYMENHRQELPGSTKIGDEKRDAINAILGIATTKNRERNALSGSFGPGSAIKQFRLDRVDAAVGTGRTGFHFDYDRANRNFMPDKPAPMPDLSKDLATAKGQAMPETPTSGKPFEFFSIRNKEKSPFLGSRFGQDIEPHGKYMAESTPSAAENLDARFEKGVVRFENPLVVDFGGGYGEASNWKNVLSSQFEGKTGFELSQAIRNAGHDGIVTIEPSKGPNRPAHTSEIVDIRNLRPQGQAMPERIAATAVIDKDGSILSSPLKTHAQLMEESSFNLDGGEFPPTKNFGFVTTTGRFVLQQEAQQLAQQAKQVQGNQPISGEIVSGLEREGRLNPEIDPLDNSVSEINKILREVGERMDQGLKLQSYSMRDELPEFQSSAVDDAAEFADYITSELAPQFPKEFADRIRSAAKNITDQPTPGQAMPEDQRAAEQSGQPSRGGLKAQALGKQDADYLAAVERGDMETAQRMVNAAAKEVKAEDPAITSRKATISRLEQEEQSLWDEYGTSSVSGASFMSGARMDAIAREERIRQTVMNSSRYKEIVSAKQSLYNAISKLKKRPPVFPALTRDKQGNVIPLSKRFNQPTPGQAMPDAVPDKGIDMPAGSMTQLYTTAAKSLPKTIPQAKSVPIVRVMIREKLFDDKGKPVLDKKGKQKEGMTPKLRDNTEVKFQPGNFDLPLPNYQLAKSKFSLGNKDFIGEAVKNRDKVVAAIEQVNKATEVITNDPFKFTDPKGYAEIMRDAGVTKNILVPPSGIDMMLKRPKDFIALLDGGFHGPRTVSGTRDAAMAGLDSVVEMRQVIGEKPTEFVTALHHLWGTLSKQLPPLDQEALWMRLVLQPEVIQQIQNSIDGTFKLKKEQWKTIVDKARTATKGEYGKLGNNATSNANSFYLMLKNHNGRWNEVANLYATDSAIDMRSNFNSLGHGATGIKNKVQGFIGLTFGIKGTVLDRWRFVDLYMDPVMQATGAPTHQHYFQYTGDAKRIPEDPIGIYANYGTIENDNPAFSLALYNGIDRAAQAAINASPELKAYLGNHADPGGLHWVTWNAIKNEAVGHSSLDLTKNFLKQFGREGTAQDWLNFANSSKAYVEGQAANGREIIRLSLDNGVFNYSRQ